MTHVFVRHKIKDYEKWKSVFDNAINIRKKGGEKDFHMFRNTNNKTELIGLFKWESLEKAKQFFESDDLKTEMQKSGITDKPDIYFLDDIKD